MYRTGEGAVSAEEESPRDAPPPKVCSFAASVLVCCGLSEGKLGHTPSAGSARALPCLAAKSTRKEVALGLRWVPHIWARDGIKQVT